MKSSDTRVGVSLQTLEQSFNSDEHFFYSLGRKKKFQEANKLNNCTSGFLVGMAHELRMHASFTCDGAD